MIFMKNRSAENMALIYANAVNKRMGSTPCRKISADCSMRSPSSRNSRESTPRKKLSCAAAIHASTEPPEDRDHPIEKQSSGRRSLNVSRLSSAEIVSKAEEDLKRKHSTPAMSQSMISPNACGNCRKKDEVVRKSSKKAGLQKYNMHSSMIARLDSDSSESEEKEEIEREKKTDHRPTVRRVQTARETRTNRSDSEGSLEQFTKRKSSILERMRRKLSSLKI